MEGNNLLNSPVEREKAIYKYDINGLPLLSLFCWGLLQTHKLPMLQTQLSVVMFMTSRE